MQQFQFLHLLILIWLTTLIGAQNYIKTGCNRTCGKVWIPFPFGIGRNCSLNKWYTVDCNSSRPYLSAFNNVEMLRVDINLQTVTVNVSMIADCENPVQNSSLVLSGSPFRFSRVNNIFVVMGCGSAAIMDNGTIVTGCSTTCSSNTVSDRNNCFGIGCCQSIIPYDLESFTLNLTGSERRARNQTCGSAFLVDSYSYVANVAYSPFVPISLKWIRKFKHNSTGCINCERNGGVCDPDPGSISGMACHINGNSPFDRTSFVSLAPVYMDPGCNDACGDIWIPHPFGIGRKCSSNEWYTIDCNSSTPYLSALNNVEVLGVSYEHQTITVNLPMISDCENQVQSSNLVLSRSPFKFSGLNNMFVVEGCGNAAIIDNGAIVTGCSTKCNNDTISDINNCFGIGCCRTTFSPNDLRSFTLNLKGLVKQIRNGQCGSAYLVDRKSFVEGRFSSKSIVDGHTFVPISLSWSNYYQGEEEPNCRACTYNGGVCHYEPGIISNVTCLYKETPSRVDNSSQGVILGFSISSAISVRFSKCDIASVRVNLVMDGQKSDNLLQEDEVFHDLSPLDFRYPKSNSINFDLDSTDELCGLLADQTVVHEGGISAVEAGEFGLSDQERTILNSSPTPDQGIPEMSFTNLLTQGTSTVEVPSQGMTGMNPLTQGMNPFTVLGEDMSELGSSSFPTLNINSTNLHNPELSRVDTFGIPTQESFTNTLELGSTQVTYLNTLELHNQGSSRMDTFGIPTQESFTNTLEFPNITTSGVPYQSPPVFTTMGDSYSNPKSILSSSDDEQLQEESDSTDGNDDGGSDSNPNSILRKSISKEMITQYFHLSLIKAARALNVGSTMLKRRCRELEIKRWPQRKVKSLETIISSLQRSGESSGENVQERIWRLENERKRIEDNPDLPLEDDTIRLRQSLYKSSHRKRKQSDRDH